MKAKIYLILTIAAMAMGSIPLQAAVSVTGNLEARNQSGVHEGDVYRNYLKADVELGENVQNTVVKIVLRAEDDTLRPEKDNTTRNYLSSDYDGSQRVYLREGYISHDIYFDSIIDSINIKMGRIIYTWGNADEQKPVDILNPQDYSNLYFTPIQERKIGVFSGSASIFFTENFFLEGVVIPEFKSSEIASEIFVPEEIKELRSNTAIYDLKDPVEPDKNNKKNSYGARLGLTLFDIDMHLNYFYGYDRLPVNKFQFKTTPSYPFIPLSLIVTPEYKQIQMIGFDFQRALFWGITLRGEGAYYTKGKYFYYSEEPPAGATGLTALLLSPLGKDLVAGGTGAVEKNYGEWTAGFDDHDFVFDDLYLNLQFNQKVIIKHEETLSQDKYINHVLWNVKYYMVNKKYCISTKGAYNIKDKSLYGNGEFLVKPADNLELMVGAWIMEGKEDTDIGQFDHNDMVYIAGKLTF
jgi:hypothetical protein